MATTIITKYGSGAPTASDVVRGELAVDTENGRLYTEDSGGSVVEIGLNPSGNVDVTGTVTADGLSVDSGSTNTQITLARSTTHSGISFSTQISDFGGGGADLIFDGSGNSTGFGFRPTNSSGTLQTGLVISPDGNVGIGTTSPSSFNQVGADTLVVGSGSGEQGITIYSGTANNGVVAFADGTTTTEQYKGYIGYNHSSNYMRFFTDASEAMRIDSSGVVKLITANDTAGTEKFLTFGTNSFNRAGIKCTNASTYDGSLEFYTGNSSNFQERARVDKDGNLLVGKTTFDSTTVGASLRPTGAAVLVSDGNDALLVNRKTSDGSIIDIRKDGTTVGSIGTLSGDLTIGTGITGIHFKDASDAIIPYNVSTGADRNGDIDLGLANNRFKDLYLSGGVYVGGTGSANYLDDYEEGTWTPTFNSASFTATGITVTAANCRYVKVGNLVKVSFTISFTGTSGNFTEGDAASLGGLPFTLGSTGNGAGTANASNAYQGGTRTTWQTFAISSSDDLFLGLHYAGGTNGRSTGLSGEAVYEI